MPTSSQMLATLEPLFREILDIPDLVVTPELSASDVLEWNSLNHIRIISAIEQKFAVRLTSLEVEKLTCAGDLATLVASKLSA